MRRGSAVSSLGITAPNRNRPQLHRAINRGGERRSPFRSPALLGLSRDASDSVAADQDPSPPGSTTTSGHHHLGHHHLRSCPNPRSESPPPVSIPSHLPQSHPHPGPIITWGPYPLPQSYLYPDPILTWDPFPPWSYPHLGPLATLVPSLLETQPYLRPTPQESRFHAGTPASPGFQCTGLKMPGAHPVPRRRLCLGSQLLQGLSPLSSSQAEPDAWSSAWAAWVPGSPEALGSYGC